jgi:hypothetical protein
VAWVTGIREVRHVLVAADGDAVGQRRGPVMTRTVRQKVDLVPGSWLRVLGEPHELPAASGAGPCGTLARCSWVQRLVDPNLFVSQRFVTADPYPIVPSPTPFAWSLEHLVAPLVAYYARYVPPLRFGAKPGPRGRRVA